MMQATVIPAPNKYHEMKAVMGNSLSFYLPPPPPGQVKLSVTGHCIAGSVYLPLDLYHEMTFVTRLHFYVS